jgi:hypothetical protein
VTLGLENQAVRLDRGPWSTLNGSLANLDSGFRGSRTLPKRHGVTIWQEKPTDTAPPTARHRQT